MKYVVACTTDYYNQVEIVETREDADRVAREWIEEPPGDHYADSQKPVIVIGEIIETRDIVPRNLLPPFVEVQSLTEPLKVSLLEAAADLAASQTKNGATITAFVVGPRTYQRVADTFCEPDPRGVRVIQILGIDLRASDDVPESCLRVDVAL